jgi:GNAT superfamily N-acetyltransferase
MPSTPQFVPYAPEHRDACLELFDENCPEFFAPNERADYARFLEAGRDGYQVCVSDGLRLGAFGVIDEGVLGRRRLNWILVARAAQGQRIGARMMAATVSAARRQGAEVVDIAASDKSAPFFARFGARALRRTEHGWGPGMHRVDMELRVAGALLSCRAGSIVLPSLVLVGRADGGHLIVNPSRAAWERSELTPDELVHWSMLAAAAGRAMIDELPQLAAGCINYWEAGNWALHDQADPIGRKDPRRHRVVHMHLFGRSPASSDPSWRWGEAPRFPDFVDRAAWSAHHEPLTPAECCRVIDKTVALLREKYGYDCSFFTQ